ncbi:uncharacterized protein LOC142319356 [Lycorma delicatula]|uniref:uncharacterized protein LOC142319356 n=1 Tax=Lycorma delicatula TaxID=130591 RepID=UPI003F50F3A7
MRQNTLMLSSLIIFVIFCSISTAQTISDYDEDQFNGYENGRLRRFTDSEVMSFGQPEEYRREKKWSFFGLFGKKNQPKNEVKLKEGKLDTSSNGNKIAFNGIRGETKPSGASNLDVDGFKLKTSPAASAVGIPPKGEPDFSPSNSGYGGYSGYGKNSYVSNRNMNINGERKSEHRIIENGQDTIYRYKDGDLASKTVNGVPQPY